MWISILIKKKRKMEKTRSVIVKSYGGYDSLSIEPFDLPPLNGNIEVKVEYGGLNFADIYTRRGLVAAKELPFVLGIECTGVITAIGEDVKDTGFEVGQKVICYDYHGGMYRDTVRLNPNNCFVLPDFIDTKLGAAIFVNYLTAYISLLNLGNLRENESVLVLSCTGGVGSAAVQIARTVEGVHIVGTGSLLKEEHAIKNGVDTFLCNDTFLENVQEYKFDVILSNESGPTFTFLQSLLRPLGRIILIGANNAVTNMNELDTPPIEESPTVDHDNVPLLSLLINNRVVSGLHLGILLATDPEKIEHTLDVIFSMIEDKQISPLIHSVWKMSEFVEATKLLEERKNVGKVLISMLE
ncbi:synaptic vesicle membrane protein VAT-1 homolog [Diabrotica virgifera virgifera]|uniref:Enoyl reductase (ER) domain-containing protein n=1 Tax=Diabrotica virgifera virgifera TaxID=50390 RepID=A0ABM5IYK5_DIAVI|nr:synaptic vesicle membrane protein VAT-1 homolog [Diabrotica virgifera virgifera]